MTTPSNFYAEKIFADQPLELWALDEETSYLSWIAENSRDLTNWTIQGNSFNSFEVLTYQQDILFDTAQYNQKDVVFSNSFQQQVSFANGVSDVDGITLTMYSPDLKFLSSQIDPVSGCISFGTMFFSNDEKVSKVRIGYAIDLGGANQSIVMKECSNLSYSKWTNLVETFSLQPTEFDASVKMVIEVTILNSNTQVDFFINGIVGGQGAEYFSKTSLGIEYGSIPDNIFLPSPYFDPGNPGEEREGIEIRPYGLSDAKGYYLIYNDFELVSQSGIPMVYGSNTSTVLNPTPHKDIPNIILPAKGFMNELNAARSRTFEFWIKINHNGNVDTNRYKIFGPTASDDGLYIDDSFLLLKMGDKIASTFIGEWSRPMLIDVSVLDDDGISYVMIDGSIRMSLYHDKITLKHKDTKDQDWVGFYAPSAIVDSIEIDCVALYTQPINETLAKRRFVYGQGVEFPLALNTAYGGTSSYVDFSKSGYGKTYDYPIINKWKNGFYENVNVNKTYVSYPIYANPEISYTSSQNGKTDFSNWSKENLEIMVSEHASESGFILNPTGSTNSYLKISDLSNFNGIPMSFVFGTAKLINFSETNDSQILSIINSSTLSKLYARVGTIDSRYAVIYSVSQQGVSYDFDYVDIDDRVQNNLEFTFGFSLNSICDSAEFKTQDIYGNDIALSMQEFKNIEYLSMYVGGDRDTQNPIDAIFTKLAILTDNDYLRIEVANPNITESAFNGILNYDNTMYAVLDDIKAEHSVYEIKASHHYPENFVEVASYGYWFDTLPISRMLSEMSDGNVDVDFLQINVDYPSSINSSLFKSYIHFQYAQLFDPSVTDYTIREYVSADDTLVVSPGTYWNAYKYEIRDGSIVHMPQDEGINTPDGVDGFNLSDIIAVITFEFRVDSIVNQPIQISKLQVAPVTLDNSYPKQVSTRYGSSIQPSSIDEFGNEEFKATIPYRITRGSSEYLYLTSKSGIELCLDNNSKRNLYIDINSNLEQSFRISSMQFAFNHRGYFSESPELAFRIESPDKVIDLYIQSINADNTRGILVAKIGNDYFNDLTYYINGIEVRSPVLKRGEWNMLGISFSPALSFPSLPGKLRIFSKILFNNFSYYQVSEDLINQYQIFKTWAEIENESWDYWQSDVSQSPNTWNSMLITDESKIVSIDAVDVYRIFAGTNKFISDSRSDDISFAVPYYQYSVYNNYSSKTYVKKPV